MKKLMSLVGKKAGAQQPGKGATKIDPIADRERRNQLISQNTTLCTNTKGRATYLLHLKPILTADGQETRKFEFGTPNGARQEKTIMLLGATGSGKTTLLNAMINYVFGVEWEDDFRVRLIPEEDGVVDETQSQTSVLTCYTIHHQDWFKVPYTLTIVDTPGFGDTAGTARDEEISEQIGKFFKTEGIAGLDHISAIGFVVQSSLVRLTDSQKYIFGRILSLFGKDIEGNIIPLFTFAGDKEPKALNALKSADINVEKYFKFNSSGLFDDEKDSSDFDQRYWQIRTTNFKSLFQTVQTVNERSLLLTQKVMEEKEILKTTLEGIIKDIELGAAELIKFEQEQLILDKHKSDIDKNKDFTYTIDERRKKLEPTSGGWQAKNCQHCQRTCHFPCGEGYWCPAVNWGGSCRVCGCSYAEHDNFTVQYTFETIQVTKTYGDLKIKYQNAKGEVMARETVVERLAANVEKMKNEVVLKHLQARKCKIRIEEIALKPTPLSTIFFIEKIIDREYKEQKEEYEVRIEQLKKVKMIPVILDQLTSEGFDVFKDQSETIVKVKKGYDEAVSGQRK